MYLTPAQIKGRIKNVAKQNRKICHSTRLQQVRNL